MRSQAIRYLILPGWQGSPAEHWQSHWQRTLPNASRVEQADWNMPDLERWSERVDSMLDTVDSCWIVAHSFGCLATMHALARRYEADTFGNVRGVFLVAPADPAKFGVANRLPGRLPITGRLVASLSDPWFAWPRAERWAGRRTIKPSSGTNWRRCRWSFCGCRWTDG